MLTDLRGFLALLEEQGDLVRITRPCSPEFEIAAGMRKTSDIDGPALLFENLPGYDMPVVGALLATRRRALWGLESTAENYFARYARGVQNPQPPRLVDRAPCQEVVLRGADADLRRLPVCTQSRKDAGAFIAAGVLFADDPEFGRNVAISRMQVYDSHHLGVLFGTHQHLGLYYERAEARGEPLPMAIAIGTDPYTLMASQVPGSVFLDEMAVAGGLLGAPIEMVRCATIPVEVPATTEIVIEGELLPGERRLEGPYGEFPGYYSSAAPRPIFRVTAITHRRDPIFLTALTGMPMTDNHVMRQMTWEPILHERIRAICPTVRDVCLTAGGAATMHAVISIRPLFKGQARDVMLAAFQTERIRPKLVTVVDDDVDPRDPLQVEWAVAFRMQGDRDILIIPGGIGNFLDPSTPEPRISALVGIDATRPFGEPYPEVVDVPGADEFEIPGWTDRPRAGGGVAYRGVVASGTKY
jgi:2,5-furandicarboxylate decarboxylase 1